MTVANPWSDGRLPLSVFREYVKYLTARDQDGVKSNVEESGRAVVAWCSPLTWRISMTRPVDDGVTGRGVAGSLPERLTSRWNCWEFLRSLRKDGRGDWIRTSGLSVPNRALYQAEPRPDGPLV
jgi:hypothetical protein